MGIDSSRVQYPGACLPHTQWNISSLLTRESSEVSNVKIFCMRKTDILEIVFFKSEVYLRYLRVIGELSANTVMTY